MKIFEYGNGAAYKGKAVRLGRLKRSQPRPDPQLGKALYERTDEQGPYGCPQTELVAPKGVLIDSELEETLRRISNAGRLIQKDRDLSTEEILRDTPRGKAKVRSAFSFLGAA